MATAGPDRDPDDRANIAWLHSPKSVSSLCAGCSQSQGGQGAQCLQPTPPPPAVPPNVESAATKRLRCSDGAARVTAARTRLLIGIFSGPGKSMKPRRAGIRSTWLRWDRMGYSALGCFVIGVNKMPVATVGALEREAEAHGDLILDTQATDVLAAHHVNKVGPLQIQKLFGWWKHAASLLGAGTHVSHVAKVDDDTFVNLPQLEVVLASFGCKPQLYYGSMAFAGYNPLTYTMCGFSFAPSARPYRRYNCSQSGATPPVPFAMGAFVLLSTHLVALVGRSAHVAAFANRSAAKSFMNLGNEDVALGFWLRRRGELAGGRPRLNITYVRGNYNIPNLGCHLNNKLYRPPSKDAIAIHFVRTPGAMKYVWLVLQNKSAHDKDMCRRMTGDGRI